MEDLQSQPAIVKTLNKWSFILIYNTHIYCTWYFKNTQESADEYMMQIIHVFIWSSDWMVYNLFRVQTSMYYFQTLPLHHSLYGRSQYKMSCCQSSLLNKTKNPWVITCSLKQRSTVRIQYIPSYWYCLLFICTSIAFSFSCTCNTETHSSLIVHYFWYSLHLTAVLSLRVFFITIDFFFIFLPNYTKP